MKIVIVTDAWHPQVNGVVRTLETTAGWLRRWGHEVEFITPQEFRTLPLPTYPDIRLSILPGRRVRRRLHELAPDAVHIATEGPLGFAARRWCLDNDFPFTTSYHTQFPEYVRLRAPVPLALSYRVIRRFHRPAVCTLAPTPTQRQRLLDRGFERVEIWSRGVDTQLFRPYGKDLPAYRELPRPISIYVGRVSVEKNIEAFLQLPLAGTRVVVGDGPDLAALRRRYPHVKFLGYRFGEDLARHLAAADVFVFPSKTDTFGLVLLEATACGVPVAAFPVTGPLDVVQPGVCGALNEDLHAAVLEALALSPDRCREYALGYSWEAASQQFLAHLRPLPTPSAAPAG